MLKTINELEVFQVNPEFVEELKDFEGIKVLIVDDFYMNPDKVRDLAMCIPVPVDPHNNILYKQGIGRNVVSRINAFYSMRSLQEPINYLVQKYFPNQLPDDYILDSIRQSTFLCNVMQSIPSETNYYIMDPHMDCPPGSGNVVAQIFLNKPEKCSGGTSFYIDPDEKRFVGFAEMKYNRLLIYNQGDLHTAYMPDKKAYTGDTYRLNQMLFI
tara:strand:+ start:188 stop:826 length:639 start_codon:yes stop_codon:yes gene_type:complete